MRAQTALAVLVSSLLAAPLATAQIHVLKAAQVITGDVHRPSTTALAFDADTGRVLAPVRPATCCSVGRRPG